MAKQITLTIDNTPVSASENTLIINAAKQAGIDIPVFCYHPKLQPVGMCRVCLVEVGRPIIDRATGAPVLEVDGTPKIQYGPKLETACTTPVSEGMVVRTQSDKARAARNEILEFLLTSHPLDCPVCDKGGECPLQNLTLRYGPAKSRFRYEEKKHLAKNFPLGELIFLDRERCIQCGRCIRFQTDLADDPVIGFSQRGRSTQIVTCSDPGFASIFSGNTTDICPVGALTTVDFRFGARPWELKSYATLCTHCPVGCNISIDVRREAKSGGRLTIKRILPRQNERVNSLWICDKGRFVHHFTDPDQRILKPMIRKDGALKPASLDSTLDLAASRIRGRNKKVVTLVGGRLSNEDLYNFQKLTAAVSGKTYLHTDQDAGDVTRYAGLGPGTDLANIQPGTVILVIASDLHEEAPLFWLWVQQATKRGASLAVINPRTTRLDKYATQVLHYRYGEEIRTLDKIMSGLAAKIHPIAELIRKADNLLIFAGRDGLGLKSSRMVYETAAALLDKSGLRGKTGSGVVVVGQSANSQGAWELGLAPAPDLAKAIRGADVLLVAGADPLGDQPELEEALQTVKNVIVLELLQTPTVEQADIVIPVQAFTERQGTLTSASRRVQRFQKALPPDTGLLPDFAIAAQIGKRLGIPLAEDAEVIFDQMAATVKGYQGLSYTTLNLAEAQWPITGGRNKYFSGTATANSNGLGISLPLVDGKNIRQVSVGKAETKPLGTDKLWAIPITQLYDLGNTIRSTKLLEKRMIAFEVKVHPDTAAREGVAQGAATLAFNGKSELVRCVLDETVPEGFVLIPRSSGIPISEVVSVHLHAVTDQKPNKENRRR